MARPALFVLITLLGLPAGYLLRDAYEGQADRSAAMVQLFETRCLPLLTDDVPRSEGLFRLSGSAMQYGDPQSGLMVEWHQDRCAVNNSLLPLSGSDQARLFAAAPVLAATRFPDLPLRHAEDGPLFRMSQWSRYPANPPAGVNFIYDRTGDGKAPMKSELQLYVPHH